MRDKRPRRGDDSKAIARWNNEGGAPRAGRSRRKRSPSKPGEGTSLYYFNLRNDRGLVEDPEGVTLSGLQAVRRAALAAARDLLAEGDRTGEDRRSWSFEIADRARRPVLTVHFSQARETDQM